MAAVRRTSAAALMRRIRYNSTGSSCCRGEGALASFTPSNSRSVLGPTCIHRRTLHSSKPPAISVYYDGGCPMCSKEMGLYQRLDAKHNFGKEPVINFVDLTTLNHKLPDVLARAGVQTFEDIVMRLHVSTSDGNVVRNAEAFVQLWERLPYWRILATFCTTVPGILPIANAVYSIFAIRRYNYRQSLSDSSACKIKQDRK